MLKVISLIFLLNSCLLFSQDENNFRFYVDAIAFRSDKFDANSDSTGMVDVYVVIPNDQLSFSNAGNFYIAESSIFISIEGEDRNDVFAKKIEKTKVEEEFAATQGSNGEFLKHVERIYLKPGNYFVKVTVNTSTPGKSATYSRGLKILDYSIYDFSLSGIMLLSSIEEINGKYKITPHSNDNINRIKDGFFAFFESYAKGTSGEVNLTYKITKDDDLIKKGDLKKVQITEGVQRHFLYIKIEQKSLVGEMNLKVMALSKNSEQDFDDSEIIAAGERVISIKPTFMNELIRNIDLSIRQMRYIAPFDILKNIKDEEDDDKKIEMFMDFWERNDPTPDTERNEALEEYYGRVKFASENFRGMNDGWLSDMGMVYIVLGPPLNTFRQNQSSGTRNFERWVYRNNRQFIFEDRSGFGDFRLVDPPTFNENYRYRPSQQ